MKLPLVCREICAVVTNEFAVDGTGHYIVQHCTMVQLMAEMKKKEKYSNFMRASVTKGSLW